jgi:hypothetical protein
MSLTQYKIADLLNNRALAYHNMLPKVFILSERRKHSTAENLKIYLDFIISVYTRRLQKR